MKKSLLWCDHCKMMKENSDDTNCPKCGQKMVLHRAIEIAICPTCSERSNVQALFEATVEVCPNCGRKTRVELYPVIN